jgi:hypothetical protein
MQCSVPHPHERLNEDSDSPRLFSKDGFLDGFGGLPVKVKQVPHAVYARTPIGHVHLLQRISDLGVEGPRTPFGEVVRIRVPAREMNAGAI